MSQHDTDDGEPTYEPYEIDADATIFTAIEEAETEQEAIAAFTEAAGSDHFTMGLLTGIDATIHIEDVSAETSETPIFVKADARIETTLQASAEWEALEQFAEATGDGTFDTTLLTGLDVTVEVNHPSDVAATAKADA